MPIFKQQNDKENNNQVTLTKSSYLNSFNPTDLPEEEASSKSSKFIVVKKNDDEKNDYFNMIFDHFCRIFLKHDSFLCC